MFSQGIKHALLAIAVLIISGCSGGGGDGSAGSNDGFTISANPSSVSFSGTFGSRTMSQAITVNFSGLVLVVGSRPNESLPNWLSVSSSGGNTVIISVSPNFVGNQSAVVRFGTGNISSDIRATTDVVVKANIQDGFGFQQDSVGVTGTWRTSIPEQQSLIVNNNGRSWRVADKSPWFSLDQMSGIGSAIVKLDFDTLTMPVGTHNGFVRFETIDGSLSATMPVVLEQRAPHIFVMPGALAVHVNSNEPASQSFKVHLSNESSGLAIPFQIAPVDHLNFSVMNGITGETEVTVSAVPGTLAEGTHPQTFEVAVNLPGQTTTKGFTAQLVIEPLRIGIGKNGVALTDGPGHSRLSATLPIEQNSPDLPAGLNVVSSAEWFSATLAGNDIRIEANPASVQDGMHIGTVSLRNADNVELDTITVGFYKFNQATTTIDISQAYNDNFWQVDPVRPYVYVFHEQSLLAYNVYTGEEVFRLPAYDPATTAWIRASAISFNGERLFYLYRSPGQNQNIYTFAEINLTDRTSRVIETKSSYSLAENLAYLKIYAQDFVYVDQFGLYSLDENRFIDVRTDFWLESNIATGGRSDELVSFDDDDFRGTVYLAKLSYSLERGAEIKLSKTISSSNSYVRKVRFSPNGDALCVQFNSLQQELYEADSEGNFSQISALPFFSDIVYRSKSDFVAALQPHLTNESSIIRYVDHQPVTRIEKINGVWGVLTSSDHLRTVSKELLPEGGMRLYANSL